MAKTKILGIAPYEGIQQLMNQVAAHRDDIELTVYVGDLKDGLEIASKYTLNDFDIIVSRGGTAALLHDCCSIPVVEISLSAMDILRSIKLAENYSNKYAFIGFPSITQNALFLCELLQYDIDIYTIHNEAEARKTLQNLLSNSVYMVLCDMITYSLAQELGLTSILITSGSESIDIAFNQAADIHKTFCSLTSQIAFYESIISNNTERICVFDNNSSLIYSSTIEPIPDFLAEKLRHYLPGILVGKNLNFYVESPKHLFEIAGISRTINDKGYVIFYIRENMLPANLKNKEIKYFNLEDANNLFYKSFYGITHSVLYANLPIAQYAESTLPLMILGENGTGPDQLACFLYAKSSYSNSPFIFIDCMHFSKNSCEELTSKDQSPLNHSAATFYIKNIEALSDTQYDELFSIIQELIAHNTIRFLFSFTIDSDGNANSRSIHITNNLSCLTITIPALRHHTRTIADLSSLYISTLNMRMAKEVLGFETNALSIMQASNWPGNYDQLALTLNELVTATTTPYIKHETINQMFHKKDFSFSSDTSDNATRFANKTLEEINLEILQQVITQENGNQSVAAKKLGISRTTLWRMLQKLNVTE